MTDTCRVTTIAIAALDEFDVALPVVGELLMPATLSEHPEWKQLGMRTALLPQTAGAIELAPGAATSEGRVSLRAISPFGRLVLIKWIADLPVERLADVDWKGHWRTSWASASAAWPAIESAHGLPPQDWLFSFSIVEGADGTLDSAARQVRELADLTSRLEAHGIRIGIGWDGGLAVRESGRCETDVDAIDAISTLVSLRWQVETQAIRLVRDMLGEDHAADVRDSQTARIVAVSRRVYLAQTALDPSIFCVYGADELAARAFVEGWGADKVTARVDSAIERLSAANELETRIRLRSSGRSQERSLFFLTLIGICGTIAGVLSAVDFRNALFSSESLRIVAIAMGALLLMGALMLAQGTRDRR